MFNQHNNLYKIQEMMKLQIRKLLEKKKLKLKKEMLIEYYMKEIFMFF